MVGVLIAMKVRVLRHSIGGSRAAGMVMGGLAGLALAIGTIVVAGIDGDLLAAVFAVWLFGWMLGPVYTGGGDESVRPEHFSLLPIDPRRLALGLLGTAFVGVPPLVSLVAFSALVVYAGPFGLAAFVVALVAAPLMVVLVVVLSRLMIAVLGVAVRSRTGAILAALVNASMNVVLNQSWVLIWAAIQFDLLTSGFPPSFSAVVRRLPSGWGVAAVEAAGRGDWLVVAAALLGICALIALALLVWSRLLVRRTTSKPLHRVPPGTGRDLAARGPVTAVAAKESRTWSRDLMRTHLLWFAVFFGLLYTLVPLIIGWYGMLPWAGVLVVVMAAATSANLFGLDGTSLWLNLVNPGTERAEVRGRQLAWLLRVAPIAIVFTVAGTIVGGEGWTWPWTLSILAAVLGGGAGLIALVSVAMLVPVTEPSKRSGNPLEAGGIFGQVVLMLLLVTLTALPAGGVAYLGDTLDLPVVSWLAVAVGVATGALLTGWFGRLAHRRLAARGPELLSLMRSGGTAAPGSVAATVGRARVKLPPGKQALVTFLWIFCWIPLFPQGLVPLWTIWTGGESRLWFLALHLHDPWRIPVAVAFVAVGAVMIYYGTVIPNRHDRAARENAG
ncbi:hypothetical protein GT755_02690 [Herbidospora sp. NEAU-GS84]|uniref:ABC-2 type transport system permease protein n=1 Tax=Herbidospora solisilvae TaxID=2696284 RepID=A0A7C9MYP1_9ACTN|nr:hypothetical protein [Herbidospora solisilvae]NAS20589.1 hypothetical protein [Herbidospora solisilvae]